MSQPEFGNCLTCEHLSSVVRSEHVPFTCSFSGGFFTDLRTRCFVYEKSKLLKALEKKCKTISKE